MCLKKKSILRAFFLWLARMPDMSLYQKMLVFYAVMAVISFLIT